MLGFQTSVDIGNRALQQCGAKRISSFTEISVAASEVSFCYDKLREAELQRKTWTFAIKEVFLRAIDANAMALAPALWSSATTYFRGSIVTDELGSSWISLVANNLNNDPLLSQGFWEPYYGPQSVPLYDVSGTTVYNAGELVYTTPGDGTYRVFLSMISGNQDSPLIKSVWLSTTTYYKNQVVTFYPLWSSGTTYAFGAAVTRNAISYVSLASGNIAHDPATDGGIHWMPLPLSATNAVSAGEWNITTNYSANNIVDYSGTLYIASAGNTGLVPPSNAGSWTAITGGVAYQSLIDVNINNEPDLAPALWLIGTTYASGNKVTGSDGIIYTSVGNSNVGHDPTTDGGANWTNTGVLSPWTTSFVGGSGSVNWLEIGGAEFPGVALTYEAPQYPVGAGPIQQDWTKNAFRLPAGFLRLAPRNPKLGTTWGGAPSGQIYNDWTIENKYLTSFESGPIRLRFIANVTDVRRMHPMFCEGLAARIGFEVVEKVTQSTAKRAQLSTVYKQWMGEARTVNAIEQGWIDPPDDDLISCRY